MRETGKTKHYGIHNVTHKRLILLCLENQERKGTTIAVEYDMLDADTRSELIQITDGPEAQSVKDLYHVLKKKVFQEHPQTTALKYLINGGFAKEYDVNDITLFIESDKHVPLAEVIRQVNMYEAQKKHQSQDTPFFTENSTTETGSISSELETTPDPVEVKTEEKPVVATPSKDDAILAVLTQLTSALGDMSQKLDKLTETKAEPKKETKKTTKKK